MFFTSDMIDGFQFVEGNGERVIVSLRGNEARDAFRRYVESKGADMVTEVLADGMAETVVNEKNELYFNVYI